MTQPCDLPATELRALIGAKTLSPVELIESCIARIETVDHAVNAMVARDFDRARAQARDAEAAVMRGAVLGPLHGLPIGIKDLDETAGLRTTFGSPIFRDNIPTTDRGIVARVKDAGAIVLGKTNTPEFGAGANTRNAVYGATANPFDTTKSAAGSSGGSAVALATGMVPIASGSDLGGSLRNPAGFCGIVGYRPSSGLVADETRGQGWSPLSQLGPMARNVPDICLLLSAMAGYDPRDPLSRNPDEAITRGTALRTDLSSLRVALSPDLGFAPTEALIRRSFATKTALFSNLFAQATETTPDCTGADEAFAILRAMGVVTAHGEKYRTRRNDLGPNVTVNVEEGLTYSAADVGRALSLQTALYRRFQTFFTNHDILITPTLTLSPRPWRELAPTEIDGAPTKSYFHWLALAYAITLTGHPAISLPVGLDEAGLPFGLQIVGRKGQDATLLSIAAALETALATDPQTARPTPNLTALASARPLRDSEGFLGFS